MHTKKQRSLVFLTCAMFIIVTFFSILFIVKEADHDCTGENCPVCACIHQAEQTLKQLGGADAGQAPKIPAPVPVIVAFSFTILLVPRASLISQKVRLND